jgi:protein SCO1/2
VNPTDSTLSVPLSNLQRLLRQLFGGWRWLYLLLGSVLTAMLLFIIIQPITVLPRMGIAPGYTLIKADGGRLNNENQRGRLTLYSFGYTRCGESADCLITAEQIAALYHALVVANPAENAPFDFITITVDPERDDPATLQAWLDGRTTPAQTAAVPWHWLTGDPVRVRATLGSGFNLIHQKTGAGEDYAIRFWPRLVLVDGVGIVRAVYDSADPGLDILLRDIAILDREVERSSGVGRLAYEAAHLFACYP